MRAWITEPGFVDCTEERYHADELCEKPSLSRSIAKLLIDATPAHARAAHPRLGDPAEEEKRTDFDIGHAAEALILRGEEAFVQIDGFDDYKKKAAKEARDAAYAEGKIPLLAKHADAVRGMAEVARRQLASSEIGDPFLVGRPQQTLVWFESGFPMRCRFDLVWSPGGPGLDWELFDFKTTSGSASADVWGRRIWDDGLDLQDAFYCRGLQRHFDLDQRPAMTFIVQETKPPYCLAIHRLTPQAQEYADQRIEKAIRIWKHCLTNDDWPGYPSYVNHIDPPPWKLQQWEERQATARLLREAGSSDIERAIRFYEPIGKVR